MKKKPIDIIPETVKDALELWDSGQPVFTVSMGGLGPGYEQALQMLAFEIMRAFRNLPVPAEDDETGWKRINVVADKVVAKLDKEDWGGFSGAMVGAAKNLATVTWRNGYRKALRMPAVKDRLIQVSKRFPQAAAR